jgi:2,4-dienoyl-CoA reductase-like NADH-dependent reductase (Old Yellow Enzyme family)/thioredoxin reductase
VTLVIESDVADYAEAVCNHAEFLSIAKMTIDIKLLYVFGIVLRDVCLDARHMERNLGLSYSKERSALAIGQSVETKMSNECKYPNLFKPLRLRGVMFRNRIFAAPTSYKDSVRLGVQPPEVILQYARRAKGGAAAVAVGMCHVDSKYGAMAVDSIRFDDKFQRHPLSSMTDAVRRYGAICTAELQHPGNCANRNDDGDPPGIAYGPVDGLATGHLDLERYKDGRPYYEMPEEIIWYTIGKFAESAAFAKACGFGMVMIHGGHGWLISQFLSPSINTRKDKWGGPDIENRSRICVEILKAVRKAVGPDFPIEMRISGSECYDGGYGIEEGIKFSRQVEDYVDLLHVSVGSHEVEAVYPVTHPSMFLPDGCNVRYAEEIKKHVKCKVATVGGLGDPAQMEDIIASGKADVVEIARGLIADPDLPRKIREGREDSINTCMRCFSCFSDSVYIGKTFCAINPETCRESEFMFSVPPAKKKKVLIAGGGIAGMQAALTSAERGHDVILCEKADRLGGVLRCEENVPFKRKLADFIERQAKKVSDTGIDIRLNTEVSQQYVAGEKPDVVIAALGARPVKPAIQGIDGANVLGAEEAYIAPEKVGDTVAVIGAGLVGVELGIYLSMLGRKVSVIEMLGGITCSNRMHHWAVKVEIVKYGIDMHFCTQTLEITSEGVRCKGPDGEKFLRADTVIYAIGLRPLWDETERLSLTAPEFYIVGDCMTPKNISNATSTAFAAARNIGM